MPDDAAPSSSTPTAGESSPRGSRAGVKGMLTRRVGPLPVWGWGIAAVGALFLAWQLRGRAQGQDYTASAAYDAEAGGGFGGFPAPGDGGAYVQDPIAPTPGSTPTPPVSIPGLTGLQQQGGGLFSLPGLSLDPAFREGAPTRGFQPNPLLPGFNPNLLPQAPAPPPTGGGNIEDQYVPIHLTGAPGTPAASGPMQYIPQAQATSAYQLWLQAGGPPLDPNAIQGVVQTTGATMVQS